MYTLLPKVYNKSYHPNPIPFELALPLETTAHTHTHPQPPNFTSTPLHSTYLSLQ